jgi:predicted PurR-regulated permease PerM
MAGDRALRVTTGLSATVLVAVALHLAAPIAAPVVFALFVIAIVWPLQVALDRVLPAGIALLLTVVAALVVLGGLGWILTWGFGQVGQWLVANSARFQALYLDAAGWLEERGLYAAGLLAERFDAAWLLRLFREVSTRLHGLASFLLVTLIFTLLGLLEVTSTGQRIARVMPGERGARLLAATAATAKRFQTYMAVRSAMSVLTGLGVYAFALAIGLDLAPAWGAIAFVLNYIPFLGPLVATLAPTIVALVQFASPQMALITLVALNMVQFLIGSWLEPRVAGKAVALSPFVVLLAVFLWTFLWGIAGAFIGVPITIAVVTFCAHFPASAWLAELLSAGD